MSEDIEKLDFQGPAQTWKPHIAGIDPATNNKSGGYSSTGYHDLDYLKELLANLIKAAHQVYNECEYQLSEFALRIDTNDETFMAAHEQVYPEDTTPGYVTFEEYKYLLTNNTSNAAQYVISSYEKKVRGSAGTNALDISLLSLHVNSECKRILEFIDKYIGEVDDSSEFRTIEIFQDWAEDTTAVVAELWKALKGEIQNKLPESELDQLTEVKASEFQALFQVKLNTINKNVISLFGQLDKNWELPSDYFYNRTLGPALNFRLKVGRTINETINIKKFPVLSAEASNTSTGLDSNFEVALADMLRRNTMYFDFMMKILSNVIQRDTYVKYNQQLSMKGKPVEKPFVKSDSIEQSNTILQTNILDVTKLNQTSQSFYNLHSDLSGLDSEDAHTQYILRTGNTDYPVTGDITVADGITIDGVDLSEHEHDGIGSKKIRGSNIQYGTLTTDLVDTSEALTSVPSNLIIKTIESQFVSASSKLIEVVVEFDVDEAGITGYEFEIVKLS